MEIRQNALTTALGKERAVREIQRPSESYINRQREFEDKARKLQGLRQARLKAQRS